MGCGVDCPVVYYQSRGGMENVGWGHVHAFCSGRRMEGRGGRTNEFLYGDDSEYEPEYD